MSKHITYIFRNRLQNYNSIEELFSAIQREIGTTNKVRIIELKHSGASPLVLLKNLLSLVKKKNNVYHITGDVHYMALVTGNRSILTIHDIKSASKGHFFKVSYIKLFWFWVPALLVKRITVISEFTKDELGTIIPFAKHKIKVVYNPVNPLFEFTPFEFNKRPTILLVGTKPNKNLERTFEALKGVDCQLTIIGVLSKDQSDLLKKFEIEFTNKSHLKFEEVIACYKSCDLLCFASTYEGFGMPIIEAQAVGRPVITSNIGAMLEIARDSACLVDPFDVDSIRNGILKICGNSDYRQQLIDKGFENIKRFQIENIAKKYLTIYEEVLN